MEENFFVHYNPMEEKGDLLYASQLVLQCISKITTAEIYTRMVMIGEQCFKYHFDVKFCIEEGQLKLSEVGEKVTTMVFDLPLKDEKEWGKFLSKKLNQQNFHKVFKPLKKIGKGSFATVFLVQKI